MKTFLAIDFGTTQSSVALITEASTREPQVIEINDGQRAVKAVATALQLDITGNIAYFGSKAVEKSEEAPERTFQNFKVFTGDNRREYQDITGQEKYTPDKLALMYLAHIRKQLEEHYFNGAKLSSMAELSCIIGCPSDWSEVRKENLKSIALSAGFPNVKLCDEPIGVIYFNHFFGGLKFKKSQQILVYDFGGGTTDIAIAQIDITDGKIKPSVLAVGGLPNLGGSNFDEAILAHYISVNDYDLSGLPVKDQLFDRWAIGLAARNAKEELSSKDAVERTINRLKVTGGAKPQKLTLTREEFMSVCAPLIERFDEPVYDTLTSAGLSADDIDAVILAGGSSAMPFVKEKMSEIFPATKILLSPSTEIIAQGLAVFGRSETLAAKASEVYLNVEDEDDDDDYDDEDASFVKRHKGLVRFAAVLVMGGALAYGYTRYTAYQEKQEQARIEQERQEQLRVQAEQERIRAEREAEQERLRVEREKAEAERKRLEAERLRAEQERQRAERERQAAERARQEAERRARQQTQQRRYLGKSVIQNILKNYDLDHTFFTVRPNWMYKDEETLGSDAGIFSISVHFTDRRMWWWDGGTTGKNGRSGYLWTYEALRNGSISDSQIRSSLRHLPNSHKVINAVLEIKNY